MQNNNEQQKQPTKGFVVVASKKPAFYYSAMNLIESVWDYMPDAQFALFTEKRFMDSRCDDVQYVYECDDHIRAKLYGMANSPFDITMYLDADTICEHEDIVKIWDQLNGNDLVFVELTKDEVAQRSFVEVEGNIPSTGDNVDLILCGGVCLYDMRNPVVRDFMKDWWEYFRIQEEGWQRKEVKDKWWPDDLPETMLRWDQFTLWWLTNKVDKYKDLKIGRFDDNYRWNWFSSFGIGSDGKHRLVKEHPIIIHHSASMKKDVDYS